MTRSKNKGPQQTRAPLPESYKRVKFQTKLVQHLKETLRGPIGLVEAYRVIMKKFWFPSCLEFSSDGYLIYNDPRVNPAVEIFENLDDVVKVFAILLVLYTHLQWRCNPSNQVYQGVTWIHECIQRLAVFAAFVSGLIGTLLHRDSKDIASGFNALLQFQERLNWGKLIFTSSN